MRKVLLLSLISFFIFNISTQAQVIKTYVWEDTNGDGFQDAGEFGLGGLIPDIQLWTDPDTDGIPDVNTGIIPSEAGGEYTFSGVSNGDYVIVYTAFPGYFVTQGGAEPDAADPLTDSDIANTFFAGANPTTGNSHTFNYNAANGTKINVDAGFFQVGSIGDYTWEDMDGDGEQEAEDLPLSGITITLTDEFSGMVTDVNGNIVIPQVSDAAGFFDFVDLIPGNYYLEFNQPFDHFYTNQDFSFGNTDATDPDNDSDADETSGQSHLINLESNEDDNNLSAGYFLGSTIGDMVWEDLDGNGIQDAGEPALNGITVSIYDNATGMIAEDANGIIFPDQISNATGYLFEDIAPGSYYLVFDEPLDHFYTEVDYSGGNTDATDVADDSDADKNLGGQTHDITITSDEDNEDIDAGYFIGATIGDFVWEDMNGDGIQDGGEPELDGITISIYDNATGVIAEDAFGVIIPDQISGGTGTPGEYLFEDLAPGSYYLVFDQPAPYFYTKVDYSGGNTDGTDVDDDSDADKDNPTTGRTHDIEITSDEDNEDIDAGYVQACKLGNYVWEDLDGNGLQDGGEPGLGGVTVTIVDDMYNPVDDVYGNPVVPQVSDGAGNFEFIDLPPGDFILTFDEPAPYHYTQVNAAGGNTDATDVADDSDPDKNNAGETHVIELESDEENLDLDAGYYKVTQVGDFVFHDREWNGIYDGTDVGVENFTVRLFKFDGSPALDFNDIDISTTTTDAAGMYLFEDLPPGDYYVQGIATGDWLFTKQDFPAGANDDASDINDDSDADATGVTHMFFLESDELTEDRVDLGIYKQIDVGGTVWYDDNQDGFFDFPAENGIGAVEVYLIDAITGVPIDATFTDVADGSYVFEDIDPGEYRILVTAVNFMGGPLNTNDSSVGQSPADDDIDDVDDGDDDVTDGSETTNFFLTCGEEPGQDGIVNMTIDFGFWVEFDCAASTLSEASCELLDEFDLICNLNILNEYCATMPPPPLVGPAPSPLCPTGGGPHNMSWFSFVAGTGDYTIEVVPNNCQPSPNGDIGVQTGIYTDCTFSEAVICDPNCSTIPVTLNSSALTPGETYYFFLDGCSGSVCDYDVNILGSFTPFDIPEPTGLICENIDCSLPVCPGQEVTFVVEGLELDITYIWSIPNGVVVVSPLDPENQTEENRITIIFPTIGTYEVCMDVASNGCDATSTPVCIEVIVEELEDEIFDDEFVCEEDLEDYTPITTDNPNGDATSGWQVPPPTDFEDGEPYTGTVISPEGCEYEQTITINAFPEIPEGILDTAGCEEFVVYDPYGNEILIYDGFTSDPVPYPDASFQGCDSTVHITAFILNIEGNISDLGCIGAGKVSLIFNQTNISPIETILDNITYIWTDANGDVIPDTDGNPKTAEVEVEGTVTLTIILEKFGVECEYPFTIDIDFDQYLPPLSTIDGSLALCDNVTSSSYTASNDDESVYQWNWTVPAPASIAYGDLSDSIVINWNGASGGEICVEAVNSCGSPEPTCITVVLTTSPIADISMATEICKDSSAIISYNGTSNPNMDFTWEFGSGIVTNGTGGAGAGPHHVAWSSEGSKMVILNLEENGCPAIPDTQFIEVVPPPIIVFGCSSTNNSIEFFWDEVIGANYSVNVLSGSSGVLDEANRTYTITGLVNGNSVEIELVVITNGPCGNIVSIPVSCTVQNCIPPDVTLSVTNDSLCIDSSSLAIPIMVDIVPPTPGLEVFKGPGILDTLVGMFDPVEAGPGNHTINYRLVTDLDGCIQTASITIAVVFTPTSSFDISNDTICLNDNVSINYTGNDNTAIYEWDTGIDGSTGAGIGPFDVSWSTPGVKTITLEVTKSFCTSTITTKTVVVEDTLAKPNISCGINGTSTSIDFVWDAITNASQYTVEIDGSLIGNQTALNYEITGLLPGEKRLIKVTAISENHCPSTSDTLTCEAKECPILSLDITAVPTICLDATASAINLSYTASGGDDNGVGTWTGPGITDPNGVFDPTTLTGGNYSLILTYAEGSCSVKDTLDVELTTQPIASFTLDDICVTDQAIAEFDGNAGNYVYLWELGTAIEDAASTFTNKILTWDTPGDYVITLVIEDNNCVSEVFSKTITVEPELDAIIFGDCGATLSTVRFTWNADDCITEYEIYIDGLSKGTTTDLFYEAIDLIQDQEVNIKVVGISDCLCGNVEAIFSCKAQECPVVNVSLANPHPEICYGDVTAPFQIIPTFLVGDDSGTFAWGGPGVTNDGFVDPDSLLTGENEIVYFYKLGECPYSFTTIVTVYEQPTLTAEYFDPDCYKDNKGSVNYEGTSTSVSVEVRLDNVMVPNPGSKDDLIPGNHGLVVETTDGCMDQMNFQINAAIKPELTIDGAHNMSIGESQDLIYAGITSIAGQIDSVIWTSSEGILCDMGPCESITISPVADDEYCVQVWYNDGCDLEECFLVRIEAIQIVIPDIFTPGSGDDNGLFHLSFVNTGHQLVSMRIFDRWGSEMFHTDEIVDNKTSWDGKFRGRTVEPGVFVYVIETLLEGDQSMIYTGDVTVVR